MASKKAGGTAKNLNDSNAKYLGVKIWELAEVPYRYREQAMVVLKGRHQAKVEMIESIARDKDKPAETPSGKIIPAESLPYVIYRLMSMADF